MWKRMSYADTRLVCKVFFFFFDKNQAVEATGVYVMVTASLYVKIKNNGRSSQVDFHHQTLPHHIHPSTT